MNKRQKVFLWFFYATFAIWLVLMFFSKTQHRVFYGGGDDLFADFFNNVRYVADRDPYFDKTISSLEHIYPPICYLLFYPFARLIRCSGEVNLPQDELPVFWQSSVAMASCVLFMVVSMIPFVIAIWKIIGKRVPPLIKCLLFFSFLFSGIVMFSFERGNLVVLTSAALALFIVRSEDTDFKRGKGWLSLAISMKIYPALFLSLMLQKRRFKQILFLFMATTALGFLPLLFFKHGFMENILMLMQNVKAQGAAYYDICNPNLTISAYVAAAARVWGVGWLALLAKVLHMGIFILGLASFFGVWIVDEKWKRWFLAAAAAILCSNFSSYYTLLYMLPAVYYYLVSEKSFSRIDWLYVTACGIWLTPFQFGLVPIVHESINPFIAGCMIIVVVLSILLEAITKHWTERNRQSILLGK